MKLRRWRPCVCAVLLFIIAGATLWLLATPRPRLSKSIVDKLSIGMSLADVERLVKAPPGDYSTGLRDFNQFEATDSGKRMEICLISPTSKSLTLGDMQVKNPNERYVAWWGCNRALIVSLDEKDAVKSITHAKRTVPSNEWLGRIRHWFESRFEEQD